MERYEIRIAGHLSPRRATALECELERLPGGQSALSFEAVDSTALYGLLARLRDLGLELVAIERSTGSQLTQPNEEGPHERG